MWSPFCNVIHNSLVNATCILLLYSKKKRIARFWKLLLVNLMKNTTSSLQSSSVSHAHVFRANWKARPSIDSKRRNAIWRLGRITATHWDGICFNSSSLQFGPSLEKPAYFFPKMVTNLPPFCLYRTRAESANFRSENSSPQHCSLLHRVLCVLPRISITKKELELNHWNGLFKIIENQWFELQISFWCQIWVTDLKQLANKVSFKLLRFPPLNLSYLWQFNCLNSLCNLCHNADLKVATILSGFILNKER